MKTLMKVLGLALVLLAPTLGHSLQFTGTHLQPGLQVGVVATSQASDTTITLTGVASTLYDIPLAEVLQGDGFSIPASTSISTGVYYGQVTSLTNQTAVICPAVNGVTFSVQVKLPSNYIGLPQLELYWHYSTTTGTATSCTVTADMYYNVLGGLTTTAKLGGVPGNPGVTAGNTYVIQDLTYTAGTTLSPASILTFKVTVDGTSFRKELVGLGLRYKPWGVMK